MRLDCATVYHTPLTPLRHRPVTADDTLQLLCTGPRVAVQVSLCHQALWQNYLGGTNVVDSKDAYLVVRDVFCLPWTMNPVKGIKSKIYKSLLRDAQPGRYCLYNWCIKNIAENYLLKVLKFIDSILPHLNYHLIA